MPTIWKIKSIEPATIQELTKYTEPNNVHVVQVDADDPYASCRSLCAHRKYNRDRIQSAIRRELGWCTVLDITYQKGGARVLVHKVA